MDAPSALVHVVDDDPSVCAALGRVLRAEGYVVSSSHTVEAYLGREDSRMPDCILVDLVLPGLDGLALQRTLAERPCDIPLVFLSGRADVDTAVHAMRQGAFHFLCKPIDAVDLISVVAEAIARGRERARQLAHRDETASRLARLTPRELQVLRLVLEGRLNKQIAADLCMAVKTVKVHRARAMQKMGTRSVAELVRSMERAGVKGEA